MEGPTPVSALLHSSTMVVAGVYLLIRVEGAYGFVHSSAVVLFGALTIIYRSLCALRHVDIKKIIAFSTTSQLGLMVCSVRLGNRVFAFFHMAIHAFFKSLIFIGSRVFIHRVSGGNQDYRMIAGGGVISFSFRCLVLSSISLGGFPFLSGFYSKDLVLENSYGPILNRFVVVVLVVGSVITVGYSVRLVVSLSSAQFRSLIGKGLFLGVESLEVVIYAGRLLVIALFLRLLVIVGFDYLSEEWVGLLLKALPLFIIVVRVVVGVGLAGGGIYSLIVFNFRVLMVTYNPLVHRVIM